jgi:hypothetical protein
LCTEYFWDRVSVFVGFKPRSSWVAGITGLSLQYLAKYYFNEWSPNQSNS